SNIRGFTLPPITYNEANAQLSYQIINTTTQSIVETVNVGSGVPISFINTYTFPITFRVTAQGKGGGATGTTNFQWTLFTEKYTLTNNHADLIGFTDAELGNTAAATAYQDFYDKHQFNGGALQK